MQMRMEETKLPLNTESMIDVSGTLKDSTSKIYSNLINNYSTFSDKWLICKFNHLLIC